MFRTLLRAGVLTACLWLAAPRPASAQTYSIRALGTAVNEAHGINAQTQVAGSHDNIDGDYHAFRWENGVLRDLGTLGGIFSEGYAINDRGDVVGLAATPAGDYHAYISLDGGAMRDIDGRAGRYSEAWASNASGAVVGLEETTQITDPRTFHAFLWNGSAMQDLGTLGGQDSVAYGINSRGQIVGAAQTPAQREHAYIWENGRMTDLGTLPGGGWSYAFAVNDAGRVVGVDGFFTSGGTFHAVLWDGGMIRDLGTLFFSGQGRNSEALAVNNQGQVVGWSSTDITDTPGLRHAVIWDDGTMRDLNALIPAGSGWVLMRATGINDKGQIVGEGLQSGVSRLFLLTPPP